MDEQPGPGESDAERAPLSETRPARPMPDSHVRLVLDKTASDAEIAQAMIDAYVRVFGEDDLA